MSRDDFFRWLESRAERRPALSLEQLVEEGGGPHRTAVIVIDLLEGFCRVGPLSSPRIEALIEPTLSFLTRCHELGIETFLFPSDAHQEDSQEFQAFPPHCLAGDKQSELARELLELPFARKFERFDKRSVSGLIETSLASRLKGDQFRKLICIGDCTDLCVYHLASGLRFLANSEGLQWDVVVPADLVATYDLPVETAAELGAMPHPGDLMHSLFLYHLELNGVIVTPSL